MRILKGIKWDQLQEGDVLVLHLEGRNVPLQLVKTCRACNPQEMWNQVCVCGNPKCPKTVESINVRTALGTGRVTVVQDFDPNADEWRELLP